MKQQKQKKKYQKKKQSPKFTKITSNTNNSEYFVPKNGLANKANYRLKSVESDMKGSLIEKTISLGIFKDGSISLESSMADDYLNINREQLREILKLLDNHKLIPKAILKDKAA